MAGIKYKKNRGKYRGSRTNGWGRQAQHRGSGSNAGHGWTGGLKHMWTWVVRYGTWFGRHGFHRPLQVVKKVNAIDIKTIETRLADFEKAGAATMKGSQHEIDLGALGYNKLLSTGRVNGKYSITVEMASAKAIEKISAAGGSVTVTASSDGDDQ
ncbi:MAG: uL15 family ribosomal protein [Candidatus Lokiarchaeota archaeon]|nr:uL15 family ribosomal protein [Candidatus Lokiarchaeota archaeon]